MAVNNANITGKMDKPSSAIVMSLAWANAAAAMVWFPFMNGIFFATSTYDNDRGGQEETANIATRGLNCLHHNKTVY